MSNKVCLLNDSLVENFLYIYFCLNFKMNNESAARFLALKFRNVFYYYYSLLTLKLILFLFFLLVCASVFY